MPRPKNDDLVKKTLFLRDGDFEKLALLFPNVKPSVSLRTIISKFLDKHMPKEPE